MVLSSVGAQRQVPVGAERLTMWPAVGPGDLGSVAPQGLQRGLGADSWRGHSVFCRTIGGGAVTRRISRNPARGTRGTVAAKVAAARFREAARRKTEERALQSWGRGSGSALTDSGELYAGPQRGGPRSPLTASGAEWCKKIGGLLSLPRVISSSGYWAEGADLNARITNFHMAATRCAASELGGSGGCTGRVGRAPARSQRSSAPAERAIAHGRLPTP